jgi:hypothetical protein
MWQPKWAKVHMTLQSFVVLKCMRDTKELVSACDTKGDVRTLWICSHVTYVSVVHSTWPSWAMWQTHAPTFNKWHTTKKKKKILHMLTHGAMWGCGLTSLVVCIDDKIHDIRERNVTIRSENLTMNIPSLGFRDIRECVTLWGLILWSLRCSRNMVSKIHLAFTKTTLRCLKGPFGWSLLHLSDMA